MKKMLVFNHKMFLTKEEIRQYIVEIKDRIPRDIEVVICPSNIYLPYFDGKFDFKLGVQNLYFGDMSSVTGECNAIQLRSLGVCYAIIGHSERRQILKEDSNLINLKIKSAIEYGITPIICIGETREERSLKKTDRVLLKQIKEAFTGVKVDKDLVIAYEPIWAIGNKAATTKEITEAIMTIKEIVQSLYNEDIKVLYGGSVNESNIESIFKISVLDGVLIGGASKDYKKVIEIFKNI